MAVGLIRTCHHWGTNCGQSREFSIYLDSLQYPYEVRVVFLHFADEDIELREFNLCHWSVPVPGF